MGTFIFSSCSSILHIYSAYYSVLVGMQRSSNFPTVSNSDHSLACTLPLSYGINNKSFCDRRVLQYTFHCVILTAATGLCFLFFSSKQLFKLGPWHFKKIICNRYPPDFRLYFIINHIKCYYLAGRIQGRGVVWLLSKYSVGRYWGIKGAPAELWSPGC